MGGDGGEGGGAVADGAGGSEAGAGVIFGHVPGERREPDPGGVGFVGRGEPAEGADVDGAELDGGGSADSIVMAAPGSCSVTAKATNLGEAETDTNTVTIIVQMDPPPVVINAPTLNRIYSHRFGTPATIVPFAFTATSSFGGSVTLAAKVDGANVGFTPAGLGPATADANFTVNVIAPTSTVVINQPLSS